jgi:SAM-dependent methyltransferase
MARASSDDRGPKLYGPLASWFHLLTAPGDYAGEASRYRRLITQACDGPAQTVLELGSGGGNNASHLKAHFRLTLVDRSPEMLAVSHDLNPECEHVEGDMRTVRLGRRFDAVFVHDALAYITTEPDLLAVIQTAFEHCRPGGAALFVPDYVAERFVPRTNHGGHDGESRSLRYVEWVWDPDPADTTYVADFAYLLRDESGSVRAEHDRPLRGLRQGRVAPAPRAGRVSGRGGCDRGGRGGGGRAVRLDQARVAFRLRRACEPGCSSPKGFWSPHGEGTEYGRGTDPGCAAKAPARIGRGAGPPHRGAA